MDDYSKKDSRYILHRGQGHASDADKLITMLAETILPELINYREKSDPETDPWRAGYLEGLVMVAKIMGFIGEPEEQVTSS
jgi:hypothetical protein